MPCPHRYLALILLLASPLNGAADPVLDQIDAARRAYQAGQATAAVQALNGAIAQIQQQRTARQLALFPAPLPGWTAEEAAAEATGIAAVFTGRLLSRTYRHSASGATVKISVSANSPFVGILTGLLQMPLLMQGDPATSLYSFGGHQGVLGTTDDGGLELSLVLGNSLLLQITGGGGATRADLEAYLAAIDLAALIQSQAD